MTSTPVQIPGYLAGQWAIDTVHSHVGFTIKHLMVSKVRGRFAVFAGTIVTGEDPLTSSVTVTIDADSIDTANEGRDEHVKSADFFDAGNHSTITFTSTGIRNDSGEFFIDGDLTIRGITKPVVLRAEAPAFGPNPMGGTKAGFTASTEINRTDFDVSYNGPIPGGGVALSEKVTITLDIEADLTPQD
ncbi:MAG: hypothetical protein C0482_29135 [Gordonia sp.]|nr:hypothetical protein [Gordonia sp. (in: high G+C Gram-positive bacteria)]